MAADDNHEVVDDEKPEVILRGGASLVQFKPVFSHDNKCLFVCCGHVIKVFSISSGECIRELVSHKDIVTCIHVNPSNHLQIFSSSHDKSLIQWDYSDGVPIRVYRLHFPVYTLLHSAYAGCWLAVVKTSTKAPDLVKLVLNKRASKESQVETLMKHVETNSKNVSTGCRGRFAASVSRHQLRVYCLKKKFMRSHEIDKRKHFTCVSCHPAEGCIATGCSDGMIYLWWNFMKEKEVVKASMHWHSLPLETLTFTAEGSYLLTGGHECVLVKWQYNSHFQDFLPRLGAPIGHVTTSDDNTLYAVCNADNMIQIVSSNFQIVQAYQGLTQGHMSSLKGWQGQDPIPAGLHLDPRTSALVTNGRPGHLQFYSLHTDKQLYNLDIVGQNYISPENLEKPIVITQIENVAVSANGTWLATVQHRSDDQFAEEIVLKFWLYKEEKHEYVLNTNVDMPHQKKVNCLLFRPRGEVSDNTVMDMAITTSEDGRFKFWSLIDDTDIYRTFSCWQCESVGFYHDRPAGVASFSEDGSIVAVAFGHALTLWEPDTNGLRTTLNAGEENLRHVEFGHKSCKHLLVAATCSRLHVWNLLTCSVCWTVNIEVSVLVADPVSDVMAVFSNKNDLIVFKPCEPSQMYTHRKASCSLVQAAIFIPHKDRQTETERKRLPWQQHSQLYFMNKDQRLLTISYPETATTAEGLLTLTQNLPQTPFSLLMAKQKISGVQDINSAPSGIPLGQPGSTSVRQLLETPPHVLPPVNLLCSKFITSLMISKHSNQDGETEESDSEDEEDGRTDSDSDMEVESPSRHQTGRNNEPGSVDTTLTADVMPPTQNINVNTVVKEDFSWIKDSVKS